METIVKVWLFTVSWCIMISMPITRDHIYYNEFGRTMADIHPVIRYNYKTDCDNKKIFTDSSAALEFYHKALKDSAEYTGYQKIYNIRIDSAEHVLVTFDDIKVQQ